MLRKSLTVLLVLVMLGATALSVSAANPKPVDLAVEQSDNPDPVIENGFVTYTVDVTNFGPEPVNKFGFNLSLDVGQYISASGYRWHCTVAGLSGECVHEGAIPAGTAAAPVSVVAQAPAATEADEMTNTATTFVTEGYVDVNDLNNSDSETTTIAEGADLTVAQSDDPDPVGQGNLMRYFVTANNNSDSVAAEGVEVSNQLSGGTFEGTFAGTDWDCTFNSTTASCSYDQTLGANTSTSILELWVEADTSVDDFTMSNTATVSATTHDSDTSNNSDTETTEVKGSGSGFASAFIPPEGGSVSTCSTSGPTDDDDTCALVTFPAGPGGIATLIEGDQIDLCETFGCVGDSVDVIVPDGYDLGTTDPIQIFFRVDESVAGPAANDISREVFVKKVVEGTEFQSFVVPSCDIPDPLLPCLRRIERIDGNDLQAVIEMFSGDPIFDVGDGLG